jgi:predicted nucleic acid-binding protein
MAMFRTSLRAPDALHMAASFSSSLTLITADKVLAACARRLGVKHKLIR